MPFSEEIIELARKEKETKDKIWVLITGSSDKNNRISRKDLEKLNETLEFKLVTKEIDTILFWGKHGHKKDFKTIQSNWLDLYTAKGVDTERNNEEYDKYSEINKDNNILESSLLEIDLGYNEFCELFDRNEKNNKRRISKRIDISNFK
ncbi:hypothetical protein RS030_6735 [Cryptosporidium xiaoi]|uniref:Uncharacterized protein n=1 Tax=Cryptosporidium xiaoi TaxID=659607 RepID=A0AAV9XWP1_9CRYT